MKLNTSQIPPGENTLRFTSTKDAWLKSLVGQIGSRGYSLTQPLMVDLRLTKVEPDYYLKGQMDSAVTQPCACCAEEFSLPISHRFEVVFSQVSPRRGQKSFVPSPDTDEVDINFFEGNEIDLNSVLEEQFILAIPYRSVCKDTCKGVCQFCGKNMNVESCTCRDNQALNAFSALRGPESLVF